MNSAQKEAVLWTGSPVLVIAGAGTGKTNTLVHRLLHLVNSGEDPRSLLLLTFTRRAAKEMLQRASALLDTRMNSVTGGTFHSFCHLFLRKYIQVLGHSPNFSILDEEDAIQLTGMARDSVLMQKQTKRFPKKETLHEIFSSSFNNQTSIEKILTKDYAQFLSQIKEIQTIKEKYESLKIQNQSVDFDDLLGLTKQILVENENIRKYLSGVYKHVLVDEYQDTNKIQAHIACLLASIHENIMVVGDDAQCIYGFRGANVRNILDFPKIFPNTKKITLEENYRSSSPILHLANSALSKFVEKYDKNLYTNKKTTSKKPVFMKLTTAEKEATFISEKILEQNESGIAFKDISILVRSGWHANLIELELNHKGIPYRKFGGRKFLEQSHIKDVISYLKILVNAKDWLSWNRILNLEPGVGPKQTSLFLSLLQKDSLELENLFWKEESFWIGFQNEAKSNISKLLDLLHGIGKDGPISPSKALESILEYYLPLLEQIYDDAKKRSDDLESLHLLTKEYSELSDYLGFLSLETTESLLDSPDKDREEEGYVTVSTVHSAKGLEWKIVYFVHLLEGQLPSNWIRTVEDLEEERRLFYVGITRAKEELYLTAPLQLEKKNIQFQSVTRFLSELENLDELVETREYDKSSDAIKSENIQKQGRFQDIQNYFLN
ncbi:DNA helicase [Leptospira kobayashii]|uniref:DNA 3'-5' helicase n=1 Tax=Leptospira kobayashii TaxID=1917830 RepID=A0ABN6KH06_9LEPT|nr:DNA helicase [Leptospira kobayashii]